MDRATLITLVAKAVLVTAVLFASSLVFGEEEVLSALLLTTITLIMVTLVLGPGRGSVQGPGHALNETDKDRSPAPR